MKDFLVLCFPSLVACASGAGMADAVPQGPPRHPSGLVLGTPVGVTTNVNRNLQIKLAGFDPVAPANWMHPRPRFESLVDSMTAGFDAAQLAESPILAISTGLDMIVVQDLLLEAGTKLDGTPLAVQESVALLKIPEPGWYAIQFAVQATLLQTKDDPAPAIHSADIRGEASQTLFSFALPGGTAARIPDEEYSVRCLAPDDMGLFGSDVIHGVDFHGAMYFSNLILFPHIFAPRHLTEEIDVYITLRPEFVAKATEAVVKKVWNVKVANSGTIYATTWKNGRWSTPRVHREWADLGLAGKPGILDGLAIDSGEKRNPGVGAYEDDKILFSTGGEYEQLDVATQIQFVALAAKQPKKVVILLPNGEYGSLATRMRAGKAVGDFCTSDPWGIPIDAERLAQAEAKMRAQPDALAGDRERQAAGAEAEGVRVARAETPGKEAQQDAMTLLPNPVGAKYTAMFRVDHLPDDFFIARRFALDSDVAPSLAIAAYRHQVGLVPHMRGCMSYPVPGVTGRARVYWGKTTNITANPMVVNWQPPVELAYSDTPFVLDQAMANDGLLRHPQLPNPNPTAAYLLRWELSVGNATYYSPIAVLRY